MKDIRNKELTLTNTVPQLVACRTSDLQLAYKWAHRVHTALAGPTAVGAGRAFVHICRRRTRVTVCEMTGGRERETGGGCMTMRWRWSRLSEVIDGQDLYVIVPHWPWLSPWQSSMSQQQMDVSKKRKKKTRQTLTKEVIFTCRSLRHTRKLHVLLLPGLKKNDSLRLKTSPFVQLKSCESGFLMEYFVYYQKEEKKIFGDNHKYFLSLKGSEGPAGPQSTGNSRSQTNDRQCFVCSGFEG